MTKHLKKKEAEREKREQKMKTEESKKAMADQKADLSSRAKKLATAKSAAEVHPLFKVDPSEFLPFASVDCPTACLPVGWNAEVPSLITTKQLLDSWLTSPIMQTVLTGFGGRYKKQQSYAEEKKTTSTLSVKQGKEETEQFFTSLMKNIDSLMVNLTTVSASWNSTSWLWGYSPEYTGIGFSPNSAGVFRCIVLGEVETWAIDVRSFVAASKQLNQEITDAEALSTAVKNLTAEQVKVLEGKGAKIYFHLLKKEELIYVPVGWAVAEKARQCTVLYGVRKSVFFASTGVADSYKTAKDLLAASGASVSKMDAVLELLTAKAKDNKDKGKGKDKEAAPAMAKPVQLWT